MHRRKREERAPGEPSGGSLALRMRILEGAAIAFGKRGLADTSVEDILEAAGVSRPTFYKVFRNKEEAFETLAETTYLSLIQSLKNAVATVASPGAKLEQATEAYLRWRLSTGAFGRALDTESRRRGSSAASQRRAMMAAATAFFEEEVRNAQRTGIDPLVYVGLIAALESVAHTLLREPKVGEAEIERRKRVILRILQATLADPGEEIPPLPRLANHRAEEPKQSS
jgi:AcrR family transcriptional regulator